MNLNKILLKIERASTLEECFLFLNINLYKILEHEDKTIIYNKITSKYNKQLLLDNLLKNDFIFILFYYFEHRFLFNYFDSKCFINTILAFKYYQDKLNKNFLINNASDFNFNYVVYDVLFFINDEILKDIHNFDTNQNILILKRTIIMNYLKNEQYNLDDLENILHLLNFYPSEFYHFLFLSLKKETCIDYIIHKFGIIAEKEFIDYFDIFCNLQINQYFENYDKNIVLDFIQSFCGILSELYSEYNINIGLYLNDIIHILNYNNFEENLKLFNKNPEIIEQIITFKQLQKNIEHF